jgi:hypothetical protein
MIVTVSYSSEVLGSGIFWEGEEKDLSNCRNYPAQALARSCFKDGKTHTGGMWKAEPKSASEMAAKKSANNL